MGVQYWQGETISKVNQATLMQIQQTPWIMLQRLLRLIHRATETQSNETLRECCHDVLTRSFILERVEKGHNDIYKDRAIKQDIAPQRHVTADPKQCRLSWNIIRYFSKQS